MDKRQIFRCPACMIIIVSALTAIHCTPHYIRMPDERIPPGQAVIDDFPNLHISFIPDLNRENWKLSLTGGKQDTILDWETLLQMDTLTVISDFHCVTGWSRFDNRWTGVLLRNIIRLADPADSIKYVTFYGADGYSTFLPVEACMGDQDLLAFKWEGQYISTETGGPVRVVLPRKYGYKSAKWLIKMAFTVKPKEGYWESRGYSDTADPWRNDRYKINRKPPSPHE